MHLKEWLMPYFDKLLVIPDDELPEDFSGIAVILPEGTSPDGQSLSPQGKANADLALNLYDKDQISYFVTAGGYSYHRGPNERILADLYLVDELGKRGVKNPDSLIFAGPVSFSTEENAHWSRHPIYAISKVQRITNAVVITHKKQGKRAKESFAKLDHNICFFLLTTNPPYGGNSQGQWKSEWVFTIWNMISFMLRKTGLSWLVERFLFGLKT